MEGGENLHLSPWAPLTKLPEPQQWRGNGEAHPSPHLGRGRGNPHGDRWPNHAVQGKAIRSLGTAVHQPARVTTLILWGYLAPFICKLLP